tara:strand:- start:9604 stop:11307 length:1704 start_codon:yes stop_codon:yes gene_type:complete
MIENIKARLAIIAIVVLTAVVTFLPNIVDVSGTNFLPQQKINYGLDIQGGLHLVMGVDIPSVLKESASRQAKSLVKVFEQEGFQNVSGEGEYNAEAESSAKYLMHLDFASPSDLQRALEIIRADYSQLQVYQQEDRRLSLRYTDFYLQNLTSRTMDQAIETIRNRIDEFGVAEPSITAQGDDRILIQLPGVEDAANAKALINRTAKLDFMLVETPEFDLVAKVEEVEQKGGYSIDTMSYSDYVDRINQDLADLLPKDTAVLFQKGENAQTMSAAKIPYLLSTDTGLGGDDLTNANVAYDQFNNPMVSMDFSPMGSKKFADLTGENIGRQMAIVLDRVVYSAPVIQSRIPGGSAQITLGGTRDRQKAMDEAGTIAVALRAGALPASLQQLEERTVGPSLGADSIAAGKKASYIAAALVVIFMLVYYKAMGALAVFALGLNMFFILSLLTALSATLTLPGIAGIALTIGMAVDANVIIYERIKEELRRGASFKKAVEDGFGHAFSAIFDANLTTTITCVILIVFGSGPVRGFAVTLIIGMVTSMFTALFVSRSILDLCTNKLGIKKIAM